MKIIAVQPVVLFYLIYFCVSGSWISTLPDDVSCVICSYLSYKNQCRSIRRINRKSNEQFNVLNNQTIKKDIDSKNSMKALLSQNASVSRNADIFYQHRLMMLNEEHLLQWMDVWKKLEYNTNSTGVLKCGTPITSKVTNDGRIIRRKSRE